MAETHVLEPVIRKLRMRALLEEDDCAALAALPCTIRTLQPSAYLIREGDRPETGAFLLSGFAFSHKTTGEGARQIVALHLPGDCLDLQNLFLRDADRNVQMIGRAEAAIVALEDMRDLARHRPAIEAALLAESLADLAISREWLLNLGRRDALGRLAHLLCEFALRLEATGCAEQLGYEFPMTQEQVADALGLTPAHVSRTLKALSDRELVRREKRRVYVPDWRPMRGIADFHERYLHLSDRVGNG